jgi:hypothetical protein
MVVVGTDVHKRTHTFVVVDEVGRKLGEKVVAATTAGHLTVIAWVRAQFGEDVLWGIEDCRSEGGAGGAQIDVAGPSVCPHPRQV